MNCVSSNPLGHAPRRRGFTFVEMLMAMAIAALFMSGVYMTFMQITKAQKASEARMEALRNGRTAISTMTQEIKSIHENGSYFRGVNAALTYGNGITSGTKEVDGTRDPGVSSANTISTLADERHARIGNLYERPIAYANNQPDLGDANVDVKVIYGRDEIFFLARSNKLIRYYISDFDGQPNVLVRETKIQPIDNPIVKTQAPIAFGVLAFDALYWEPNKALVIQTWQKDWDSALINNFTFTVPASVYLRLTLSADPRPPEAIAHGAAQETIILESVVNIEEVIADAKFQRPIL